MNMCWLYIDTNNNICVIEKYYGSNPLEFVRSITFRGDRGESNECWVHFKMPKT